MDIAAEVQQQILQRYFSAVEKEPLQRPFLVGLCGMPGSGKSTVAKQVQSLCNSWPKIQILSMDGYHLPLKDLDSASKVYRRGAKDTFDLVRFGRDVARLKTQSDEKRSLFFPGFDHAKGDPEENEFEVVLGEEGPDVVIIEGLYVLSEEVASVFDLKMYIEADLEKCVQGLKQRNLVIPGYSEEEVLKRVDLVDRVNAGTVQSLRHNADVFVQGFNA